MHPPNQRLGKPDKLSQGANSHTSYPKVQWGNTLDKRGLQNPSREKRSQVRRLWEHRVTVKKHTRIYPCCRKLADRHKAQDMS